MERRMLPFLDENEVRAHLRWDALIAAMENALIDFSAGRVQQPVRRLLKIESHQGFFAVMPAASAETVGAKLVTFYPSNAARGLPTHLAVILLFAPETGEALNHVRTFEEIRVWSRTPANAERFAEEVGARVMTAEAAVRGADVIVTATAATEPILQGAWLKPGAHVNAIGWGGHTSRELDDAAMANVVVVESREAAHDQCGDVILSGAKIHAELGEILAGDKPAHAEETTIFDSVGIAVEDIAAARLVYEAARGTKA